MVRTRKKDECNALIHVLLFGEGTWGRKGDVKAVEARKPRRGSMQDILVVKNAEGGGSREGARERKWEKS